MMAPCVVHLVYNRKQRKLELPKEIVMRILGNSTSLGHTRKRFGVDHS